MQETTTRSEDAQREYYDRIAEVYDRHYASDAALKYRWGIYHSVLEPYQLEGKAVLDAMCGGGESTYYFLKRGASVTGLDISGECCRLYQEKFPDSEAVQASALSTGLASESFDFVMTDSLHHLHPHVNQGVEELTRLVRPGGYICFWEPSARSIFDLARRLWYRLDPDYFQENESAIDISRVKRTHALQLEEQESVFGGNLAYLLVSCSMAFRIPISVVNKYADALIRAEASLNKLQPEFLSLWSFSVFQKK